MSAPSPGPLTQLALSIQADNQRFQESLTHACSQAAQNPGAALAQLDRCWEESNGLESRELDFLAKMGDFGAQQVPQAKNSWRENRLQILVGKAQVLLLLGRYDEAQSAINLARMYTSGRADMGSSLLDQLEIAILQARS